MSTSILSWNIFANVINLDWRTAQICRIIKETSNDVVCLQEVLYNTWLIINEMLVKTGQYVSAFKHPYENNTSGRAYGEVILVKSSVKLISKRFTVLMSSEGRTCSFVDIVNNAGIELSIGTAHLESGQTPHIKSLRDLQIQNIKSEFTKNPNWIWVGDSNIRGSHPDFNNDFGNLPTWHENRFWAGKHSEAYDKTMTNQDVLSIVNVGTDKIDNKWLSDHDGIIVTIK